MKYDDFVDLNHKPGPEELICTFKVKPREGINTKDAAGRIASESSNGTWSKLQVSERIKEMSAKAFDINNDLIKISYKPILFEPGNMPQILSCIAGNIMGMKAVNRIRLMDCKWPEKVIKDFYGPQFGSSVKDKIFNIDKRPLTATVPKPKVGLTSKEHAEIGYQAWTGGIDLLKDDENLTSQSFNRFKKRIELSFKNRNKAEKETGEKKSYLVNITADLDTMLERAEMVKDIGGEYVMVDIITTGWSALQSIRRKCEELGLAIHAHRAMHAAFDRISDHGVSMRCIAQFARIIGVDQIHTGTANLGKLENEDTININKWLRSDLYGIKDVLPIASGGLHAGLIPDLIEKLGTDIGIQIGGGTHSHPKGTHGGAKALRQAIEAKMDNIDITEHAKTNKELKEALEKWGAKTPI